MKLYLVQHGKAVPKEVDADRPLSQQGRDEVRRVAEFIRPLDLRVGCIRHSGKTRSAQTAEMLSASVSSKKGTVQQQGLAPNDNVMALQEELGRTEHDVMIVGHLPFLNKLASLLVAGSVSAEVVEFKNGGIVCLNRLEDKRWRVSWAVTPELVTENRFGLEREGNFSDG